MTSSSNTSTPDHSILRPTPLPDESSIVTGDKAALDTFRQLVARYRRAGYEGLAAEFEQRVDPDSPAHQAI